MDCPEQGVLHVLVMCWMSTINMLMGNCWLTLRRPGTSGSHDANFAATSSALADATHSPLYTVPSPPGVATNAATLMNFPCTMGYLMML